MHKSLFACFGGKLADWDICFNSFLGFATESILSINLVAAILSQQVPFKNVTP